MKIITGKYKGRNIPILKNPQYRPTLSIIREAIFSIIFSLQLDLPNLVALDLFCGSGSLGLECLSRGANHVYFVDSNRDVINNIRDFVKSIEAENADVILSDVRLLLKLKNKVDIVFIDPPYYLSELIHISLDVLHKQFILNHNAYLFIDADKAYEIGNLPKQYTIINRKVYHRSQILLLRYENEGIH